MTNDAWHPFEYNTDRTETVPLLYSCYKRVTCVNSLSFYKLSFRLHFPYIFWTWHALRVSRMLNICFEGNLTFLFIHVLIVSLFLLFFIYFISVFVDFLHFSRFYLLFLEFCRIFKCALNRFSKNFEVSANFLNSTIRDKHIETVIIVLF